MNNAPFIALVHNAALLMALVLVYDLTVRRYPQRLDRWSQLAVGGMLGLMGLGVMVMSFELVPGIVFDTRSVLLALAGLFFGVIPTAVAVVVTAAFRLSQGGAAAWTGTMVIMASAGLGLVCRWRCRGRLSRMSWRELFTLGLSVHVVMLALMFTLGWSAGARVVAAIGLPVMLIYPAVTTVLGLLLSSRLRRLEGEQELQRTSGLLRMAGKLGRFGGWRVDLQSNIVTWSDEVAAIHDRPSGYSPLVHEGISYYAPEWRDKITACFQTCATQGVPYDEEMEIITARGRRVWVHTIGEPVRNAAGRIVAVQGMFQDISEIKSVELALTEREALLRRVGDNLPASYIFQYARDADGRQRFHYLSAGVERVHGHKAEAILANPGLFHDQIYPDQHQAMAEAEAASLRDLTDFAFEARYHLTGETQENDRWLMIRSRPHKLPAGLVIWDGVATDITDVKRTERGLKSSEERYRSLFENYHTVMLIIDPDDGRIVDANPAAVNFYGWTREELRRKRISDINRLPAAEIARLMAQARNRERNVFQFPHGLADGSIRQVEVFSGPISQDGRQLMYSIIFDITARRQAEEQVAATQQELARLLAEAEQSRRALLSVVEDHQTTERALRASEDRWRHAVQGSAAGIWENDFVTGENFYSDRSKEMLGYAPEDIPADLEAWTSLILPEDAHIGQQAMAEHLAGRRPYYEAEHRMRCKDGTYRWISSHARAVHDVQGRLLRISGTHVDIHERKLAEEKLRASLGEKEALLKEVHHRVKNNLQVITSLLRLEAGRSQEPSRREVLQEMQSRIRSMALLHETLYRSGNFAGVNLADYLRQVATQIFRAQNAAPERVQLSIDLAPVTVEMDQAIPCGLIVNELVTNSLKHAFPDDRKGAIKVVLHRIGAGPLHQLEITDNGVGLPADFDVKTCGTLGMQLVTDLSRQLQGEHELGRGPGAKFALRFTPRATGGPQVT